MVTRWSKASCRTLQSKLLQIWHWKGRHPSECTKSSIASPYFSLINCAKSIYFSMGLMHIQVPGNGQVAIICSMLPYFITRRLWRSTQFSGRFPFRNATISEISFSSASSIMPAMERRRILYPVNKVNPQTGLLLHYQSTLFL